MARASRAGRQASTACPACGLTTSSTTSEVLTLLKESARISGYTGFVARNVTIKISEEAILWARRKAAEENTSLSRLIGEMLERQMRLTDEYWQAFDHWKLNRPLAAVGAGERLSREELHARR